MTTLRNQRKLVAVSRETPDNTRNSQSQNTLDPGMTEEYVAQVSEKIEGKVTRKFSKEFSRTESRILGALSILDEFLLNPQVRTCSIAVPRKSRNNDSENREPSGDRSLGDPCPEAVFSSCHPSNLNDSEQDETHHSIANSFCSPYAFCLVYARVQCIYNLHFALGSMNGCLKVLKLITQIVYTSTFPRTIT